MRKVFFILFIFISIITASHAQAPQLTVNGKINDGVHLQELKIQVKVCGTVATTTWQMTFKNTTSRAIEGTLNFPLKNGLSASRYALDINGKMRDAVPVDRAKGTAVFEAIQRRRVDPGLLEKLDGNTFRTRIYPINANNTRTVIIGYEEELQFNTGNVLQYRLPLQIKDTIKNFELDIDLMQSASRPVFDSSLYENLQFTKSNNQYRALLQKQNYVAAGSLSFSIKKQTDVPEVMLQQSGGQYYFLINALLLKNEKEKTLPASIGLLWDASLSANTRDLSKEAALLDLYFKKLNSVHVNLVVFSNSIKNTKKFFIQNGNWDDLKKYIETIVYDGATDLGKLDLRKIKSDEYILLSDGHHTLGNSNMRLNNRPVYCINSSPTADYSNLKYIARKTEGLIIDLQNTGLQQAFHDLIHQPFRFLGIKQNAFVKEYYPALPVVAGNSISLGGIAAPGIKEIILQFGYSGKVTFERSIAFNKQTQLCSNFDIGRLFAQKKIAELDIQYEQNKNEIESTGNAFGIVTRNTSLIVLETLDDYIKYQVFPPAELRAAYDSMMEEKRADIITKQKDDLQISLDMIDSLKAWYNQKLPQRNELPKNIVIAQSQSPVINSATTNSSTTTSIATNSIATKDTIVAPSAPTSNHSLFEELVKKHDTSSGSKLIAGKVIDENGNPVSFASVIIKGTKTGVIADANGAYYLRVNPNTVLAIDAQGLKGAEVPVGTQNVLNTVMEKSGTDIKEVVVTSAFGIRRNNYNEVRLQQDQVNAIRLANVNNALAGKVAGAQVNTMPPVKLGAETFARLGGQSGEDFNSKSLYIVDGKIMPENSFIEPGDVDHYDILDDGAAESLFGPDGSNGAIVISTKNFKPDSTYKKIADKIADEKRFNQKANPPFDITTFDYLAAIKQRAKEDRYEKYLELRHYYTGMPTYFLEVATYFLNNGDKAHGLTILSNLAELENSNYEGYKMLGYKLKETGEYENALSAFKKVLELRPADPQSYRDCALAYRDLGNYQQALQMLNTGLTKTYIEEMYRMYEGIEEVFLTEMNHLVTLHKNKLNLEGIDKKILSSMEIDLRIVMNWNLSNTDIDLWVTDPTGEKCSYENTETKIGARLTNDFTEGFGPEQFMLKKAVKGKYKIEIDFYSDSEVKLPVPVTMMIEVYKYYGTAREEKKIITLQLQRDIGREVFVAEVEF